MKMPSTTGGQHSFAQVPRAEIPRSQLDRSFGHKTTFDAGLLIPVMVDEALPGDTFNVRMSGFARLATPLKPLMDNMYLETFFFAVPYRLIWNNWEKFNGAQAAPGDSTSFLIPITTSVAPPSGSLADYFGLPLVAQQVSSLYHRAYWLIWNQWFRDQNLQATFVFSLGDGPDNYMANMPLRRGKRHDYFTSCLPWPQKGTSVSLPLGTFAPVQGIASNPPTFRNAGGTVSGRLLAQSTASTSTVQVDSPTGDWTAGDVMVWDNPQLQADLSTASAATINQLRQAFQIQKLLERDARGGTRYTEVIKAHFGVTSPDARLQRSEYLGGGSSHVVVSPIAQNSAAAGQPTPQGNLAGIGTVSWSGHGFAKSFTEHCIILGLVSVRADLSYQQGIERQFSRRTRYDFYWPALAHIGEQAVLNKEIFYQNAAADNDVFGYQERYAEYRYKPSIITGAFRSTLATPLDMWHLGQEFSALPVLGATFIQEDPPVDRVIAVPSEPHFIMDSFFKMVCARPMPVFGVPGMVDHF